MTEPTRSCPKCGFDMEYIDREPDVGIMLGGFFCTNKECEHTIDADDDYDDAIADAEA